ncbi:UNVERIFIED_CONTAM: hypothetical protein K2H54_059814 [Gekko kuhli]
MVNLCSLILAWLSVKLLENREGLLEKINFIVIIDYKAVCLHLISLLWEEAMKCDRLAVVPFCFRKTGPSILMLLAFNALVLTEALKKTCFVLCCGQLTATSSDLWDW